MIRDLTFSVKKIPVALTEKDWDDFVDMVAEYMGEGLIIPDSYKEFMFKYNGGSFSDYVLNGTSAGDTIVSWFYSWDKNKTSSLQVILENFDEDYSGYGFLPFADDPGGNCYLLNLNPDGNGEVYYWLHDDEFENGDNKALIFNNFVDFLNALEPEE
ncbi:MAG: SMI1/KNR4 family protein [Capnocytophaga sp.]|nr:SMI1/KNR4 family protein [Capnocytophaga sp.]